VTVAFTPQRVALLPNAPNPFRSSTRLRYTLTEDTPVSLQVYDLLGRRVATLVNEEQPAGRHTVMLDGKGMPSGSYVVRLQAGTQMRTQRIVVVQ
jgi:flagellar hook assembly protein FlgD